MNIMVMCRYACINNLYTYNITYYICVRSMYLGGGGELVELMSFDRRVVGSNPALAAMLVP